LPLKDTSGSLVFLIARIAAIKKASKQLPSSFNKFKVTVRDQTSLP